jgi:uncharacterized protein (TIGR00369 family)
MINRDHYMRLENMMHSSPVMQLTGGRVAITRGEARITLPVRSDFFHSAGAMHGALYFLALDNAAFFAVNSLVEDVLVLTVSLTTYITRPVSEGIVTANGKAVYQNRSQFIGESVLYDSGDHEIARANGIFVRSKIALTEQIGYQ